MPCRNADKRRLGDVAVLDLDSFTWRRPAVTASGTAPSPREGAAAAYHAGHMVLFGEDRSGSSIRHSAVLCVWHSAHASIRKHCRQQQQQQKALQKAAATAGATHASVHMTVDLCVQVVTRLVGAPTTCCCWSCRAGRGPNLPRQAQRPAPAAGRPCASRTGATWSSRVAGTTLC